MSRYLILPVFALILTSTAFSQNKPYLYEEGQEDWHEEHHNRVALFTGTTLVPTHLHNGNSEILFVPTYGIEYERGISSWFALGITNEIELQNYVIETESGETINRSFIYVAAVFGIIQPINNLYVFVGPGIELTSDHNFTIAKIGLVYSFRLTHHFDLSPEIAVDQVSDQYTTLTFGISIGKRF